MDALIRKLNKGLLPLAAGVAMACAGVASAAPIVGLNIAGTGQTTGYGTHFDLATDSTNSGLAVGFSPATPVGTVTDFLSQTTVTQLRDGPTVVSPLGLDNPAGFEISKVLSIAETLLSRTTAADGSTTVTFGMAAQHSDLDNAATHAGAFGPVTAGNQQLSIFLDPLGDGSTAVPGNGAGTVKCYGTGTATSTPALCTGNDGTLIASAHLVSETSSFTAQAGNAIGTGSFDLRFVFDYVNPDYLQVAVGSGFSERLTGTLNIPSLFTPAMMFDGTLTNTGVLFKVDSSESFATVVPEPGTMALLGLGFAALGFTGRRRTRG